MKEYIFDNKKEVQEAIIGDSLLLVCAMVIGVLFLILGTAFMITKKDFVINIIKEKLMWSSVFRGSI